MTPQTATLEEIHQIATTQFKEPDYITEARIFMVSNNKAQTSLYRVGKSLLKTFHGRDLSTRKLEARYRELGIPMSHVNISRALLLARGYKSEEDLLKHNFSSIAEAVKALGEPDGVVSDAKKTVMKTRHQVSTYLSAARYLIDSPNLPVDADRVKELLEITEKFQHWIERYMRKAVKNPKKK